ncbi:MAG: nucleotidyltransferase family protein [Phenylobacterium sp.]|uniref:nucleotidyltransferase family protein n=1 Tax=Phenylobacterium sp. TaxID=1871053 RepID=UPI001B3F5D4D|nr:nucleotidyltransferase family protein [Phenylobacterium sp.]MBP7650489.1 nucleotidyltransferase family protein [Phenylobacterium sp.]MBP7818116.1 nucleotidyltransferase family protein [Phenylobacterium sp.]
MAVMETARELALPDWLVFSGAIYQRVLNHLTGRHPDHGIKDYDLAYFDPDTSWEAEDAVIRRVAAAFEPPVREMVEVRNQARVHLWFEAKFGEPYAPLTSSAQALTRFASPLNAVAARLEADGSMTIVAPFGLEDLFSMTYRANPNRRVSGFARTAEAARSRWPELTIIPQT